MKTPCLRVFFTAIVTFALAPAVKAAPSTVPEVKDLPVQTNLPDVMTMADGTKVTTPEQWQHRRDEMKKSSSITCRTRPRAAAARQCERAGYPIARPCWMARRSFGWCI